MEQKYLANAKFIDSDLIDVILSSIGPFLLCYLNVTIVIRGEVSSFFPRMIIFVHNNENFAHFRWKNRQRKVIMHSPKKNFL